MTKNNVYTILFGKAYDEYLENHGLSNTHNDSLKEENKTNLTKQTLLPEHLSYDTVTEKFHLPNSIINLSELSDLSPNLETEANKSVDSLSDEAEESTDEIEAIPDEGNNETEINEIPDEVEA